LDGQFSLASLLLEQTVNELSAALGRKSRKEEGHKVLSKIFHHERLSELKPELY
jgi:hypothetical protein